MFIILGMKYRFTCDESKLRTFRKTFQRSCTKNQLFLYDNDLEGTWNVIKEVIGKRKVRFLPLNKIVVDNIEITDSLLIAKKYNNFAADIGPNWLQKFSIK